VRIKKALRSYSSFGFRDSFVIRHSCFVIFRLSHKRNSKAFDRRNQRAALSSMMKLRIAKLLGLAFALGLSASASAQMTINGAG
jgi:hypothetical protein